MRSKIFRDSENITNFTFGFWLKKAENMWDFADSYVLLTKHNTLEERKEDNLLSEYSKELIARNFEADNGAKHK